MAENNKKKPNGYWTKELLIEDARKYKTKRDWRDNSSSAYVTAKRLGFLDVCCSHMTALQKPSGYWTPENIKKAAKKFDTPEDFENGESGAYDAFLKFLKMSKYGEKFREECFAHMTKRAMPPGYWTFKRIKQEARNYSSITDWLENSAGSYDAYHNLSDEEKEECTSHMVRRGGYSVDRIGYFYILDAVTYLKVGITNFPNKRVKSLNRKHGSVTLFVSEGYDGLFVKNLELEWLRKTDFSTSKKSNIKIPFQEVDSNAEDGKTEVFEKKREYVEAFLLFLLSKKVIDIDSSKKILMGINESEDLKTNYYKSCDIIDSKLRDLLKDNNLCHKEKIGEKNVYSVFERNGESLKFILETSTDINESKSLKNVRISTLNVKELEFFLDGVKLTDSYKKQDEIIKINKKQLKLLIEEFQLTETKEEENIFIYSGDKMKIKIKKEEDKYIITDEITFKKDSYRDKFDKFLEEAL